MNRFERMPVAQTEAKLDYGHGEYRIVRPGAFVRCAITAQPIRLENLRYWNVEKQEAYAGTEALMGRHGRSAD